MNDELDLEGLGAIPIKEPVVEAPEAATDEAAAPVEPVANLSAESDASVDNADVGSDVPAATKSAPVASTQTRTASLGEDEEEANESEQTEEADAGQQVAGEFSKSLHSLGGKWYILHTYSGYEKRVKTNIESHVASFGMEDQIFQVGVPMEEVEKHVGKDRKVATRVRIPDYVLIRMWPDENIRRIVRGIEGMTDLIGPTKGPAPLSRREVVAMMVPMITSEALKAAGNKPAATEKRRVGVSYAVGGQITVTDGSSAAMAAVVSDVESTTRKPAMLMPIFGCGTPVELSFHQVQKLD